MQRYTYLIIDLLSILFPLLFSFHKKIGFYRKWKYIFPALACMWIVFLPWDYLFTGWNIWSFNPDYITGLFILNLPVEEWLFFLCIPYSCLFIYESLRLFLKEKRFEVNGISSGLLILFFILGIFNIDKAYTFSTSLLAFAFLSTLLFLKADFMDRFYIMYLVSFIFFFIINGLLTSLPVVIYNNNENIGIRISSIPVEDMIYSFLMLLIPVSATEWLEKRKSLVV